MIRIAFFLRYFPKLSETFILNQVTGLIDKGVDVHIVAQKMPQESKVHESYEAYHLRSRTTYWTDPFDGKSSSISTRNRIKTSNGDPRNLERSLMLQALNITSTYSPLPTPNVVFAHYGPNGYLASLLRDFGMLAGPIATFFHGYDMSDYLLGRDGAKYRALFKRGELMLPISCFWRRKLIELGCPKEKILVHRMGVDPDLFTFQQPDRPLGRPVRVVSACRITEKKGLQYAVRAVAKVAQTFPIRYEIIGDGELFSVIAEDVKRLRAGSFIVLSGSQSQEYVRQSLADADVFLLPCVTASNSDADGIPVALMESMAAGLITVSTTHFGIPELITDGVSGFLVPENNIDALANILVAITRKRTRELERVRRAAREKIENEFNIHKLNDKLVAIALSQQTPSPI